MENFLELTELNKEEIQIINGGGLAYDFGFVLREIAVAFNSYPSAAAAYIAGDLAANYRPVK